MNRRACFITLEGGEGAGKSTQIKTVCRYLQIKGIDYVLTREPGGTAPGERIRELLLDKNSELADDTELLLMFAARAEHLHKVIRPALKKGIWVISDRFTDATYAYQGGGRGISDLRIAVLEDWVQTGLQPDLTLLFDCTPAVGMQRAAERSDKDRFESEAEQFFARVRSAYLQRAQDFPERFVVINADLPVVEVGAQVEQALENFIMQPGRCSA